MLDLEVHVLLGFFVRRFTQGALAQFLELVELDISLGFLG